MLREFFLSLKKGFRDERQVIKKKSSRTQIIRLSRFVGNL